MATPEPVDFSTGQMAGESCVLSAVYCAGLVDAQRAGASGAMHPTAPIGRSGGLASSPRTTRRLRSRSIG